MRYRRAPGNALRVNEEVPPLHSNPGEQLRAASSGVPSSAQSVMSGSARSPNSEVNFEFAF